MTATKSRTATAKPKAPARPKMSKDKIEAIDASIEAARGSPGFEMVRALGELAKLGPYKFKKIKL